MSNGEIVPFRNPLEEPDPTLEEVEARMEQNRVAFIDFVQDLTLVRDLGLWREGCYESFDDYCQLRWGIGAHHASRLIALSMVQAALLNMDVSVMVPDKESQGRELYRLLDDPERLMQVWKSAVAAAGGDGKQPTAAGIRAERNAAQSTAEMQRIRQMISDITRRAAWQVGRDATAILEQDAVIADLDAPWRADQAEYWRAISDMGTQVATLLTTGQRPDEDDVITVEAEPGSGADADVIPLVLRLRKGKDGTWQ